MEKHAVVLLSGGLDSATALGCALADGYAVHPLSIEYGQRHIVEQMCAQRVVAYYRSRSATFGAVYPIRTAKVDISGGISGSALTDAGVSVPFDRPLDQMVRDVPVTYVPARNTFMLGLAASVAEQEGAERIYTGFNVLDYSGYPDCRPEYVQAMNATLRLGLKDPVMVVAPLVALTKVEIIQLAKRLGVPMGLTWSCYSGGDKPCGRCDSCAIRAAAFDLCNMTDPAVV